MRDWAPVGVDGLPEFDPTNLTTTSFLSSRDLEFDADGNFELILSQNPPKQNGLALQPETTGLLIRTAHNDRSTVIALTFEIERLDQPTPWPIRAAEMSEGLAKTAQIVLGYAELVRAWWFENLSQRPNTIDFEATYLSNGGVLDRLHGFGCWQKPSDTALVVRFTPAECEHWILQVCNRWQENLDVYEDGRATSRSSPRTSRRTARSSRSWPIGIPGSAATGSTPSSTRRGSACVRSRLKGPPSVSIQEVALAELEARGIGPAALEGVTPIPSGGPSET